MVAAMAPAHGVDNVVPDKEDSGGPPLPHWGGHRKERESMPQHKNYTVNPITNYLYHTCTIIRWKAMRHSTHSLTVKGIFQND